MRSLGGRMNDLLPLFFLFFGGGEGLCCVINALCAFINGGFVIGARKAWLVRVYLEL
jgi:hypothetical protein